MTKCEVFGVYLIDFKINEGGELSNKHYGLVLTKMSSSDKTFLVAPMTSKKRNKRYRGGITVICEKYQNNPSAKKAFIQLRKIREVSIKRLLSNKKYSLDEEDAKRLKVAFHKFFKHLELDMGKLKKTTSGAKEF